MTCELVRDVICEYIDGELDERKAKSLEMHLEQCPACRNEVGELRETLAWLKQAEDITPPPGLRQAVLGRIEKEKDDKIRSRRFAPGFTQAVAAAAIFIFLVTGNITLTRLPGPAGMPKGVFELQSAPSLMEESTVQGLESPDTVPPEDSSVIRSAAKDSDTVETETTGVVGSYGLDSGAAPGPSLLVKYSRVILNAVLLPLFAVFAWLAIKKRKVA